MKYIYSTLSSHQSFTVYKQDKDARLLPIRERVIVIKGQANIVDQHTFVTPKGAVTSVNDEDLKALQKLPAFNRFVERGFISVEDKEAKSADVAAEGMKAKDKSAQRTKKELSKTAEASTDVKVNKQGK